MFCKQNRWWDHAIIYEIYTKSFRDGNGDNIGDLTGVISRLDYLCKLGIDTIWLCPVFLSPFKDGGYDISDYYKINPDFGTMDDMEKLIKKAHQKNIKIILDMVINHTSNQHPWFLSACQSKSSPYRDYYIFRETDGSSLPNNWISSKTLEPVWTYNPKTNDYYLHIYTKYQPDLNWDNKEVREEIYKILKFWLKKGIDGYRFDVINKIAKAEGLPNLSEEDVSPYADHLFENQEMVHEYIKELNKEILTDYPEALLMGQTSGITTGQAVDYVHPSRNELHLYLQFEHVDIDKGHEGRHKDWSIKEFKESVMKWQMMADKGVWPTVFFGSHDLTRMVEHFGNIHPEYHSISAKMLAVIQLGLAGTQIIYMGDELALKNVEYKSIGEFTDIRSHSIYQARLKKGEVKEEILKDLRFISRDNARYPIPWERAERMSRDNTSVLEFYKRITEFRKSEPAVLFGSVRPILDNEKDLFAYQRNYRHIIITVLANMTGDIIRIDMTGYGIETGICNYEQSSKYELKPYEARIYKLETG